MSLKFQGQSIAMKRYLTTRDCYITVTYYYYDMQSSRTIKATDYDN